jgi:ATP-binding cassette, subfamily A (ABC1), member 3
VGLTPYARRLAATLSGGNKRKLSLAIAVVGNPKVLLLDEPSSGMDAVSKRMMWRALEAVKGLGKGRGMAMVITSHSMEEVSALSDRVGIMRGGMLAVGAKGELIRRFGDRWHVHVMLRGEVVGNREVEGRVRKWIEGNIVGARIEREMLHGQLRFWVPRAESGEGAKGNGLADVFRLLEERKDDLCIEYYSVVQTNLEDVFLNVVGQQED